MFALRLKSEEQYPTWKYENEYNSKTIIIWRKILITTVGTWSIKFWIAWWFFSSWCLTVAVVVAKTVNCFLKLCSRYRCTLHRLLSVQTWALSSASCVAFRARLAHLNSRCPSLPAAERTGALGVCGWIIVILSGIFTLLLFPFTIWFCLKVSELVQAGAAGRRAETWSFTAFLDVNLCLWWCCRLFRSTSELWSSDLAALQTGGLKDQVGTLRI